MILPGRAGLGRRRGAVWRSESLVIVKAPFRIGSSARSRAAAPAQRRAQAAGDVGAVEQVELGDRALAAGRALLGPGDRHERRARRLGPGVPLGRDARGAGLDRLDGAAEVRASGRTAPRSARFGAGERLLLAHPRAALEGAAHQLEVGEAVGRHRQPALVGGGRQVQADAAVGMPLAPAGVEVERERAVLGRRSSAARPGRPTRACRRTAAASAAQSGRASAPSRAASAKAPSDSATMRGAGSRRAPRRCRTPARTSSCSGPPWRAPCSAAQPMSRQSARPTPWARSSTARSNCGPGLPARVIASAKTPSSTARARST